MEDEVWEKLRSGIYIIKRKKCQAAKSNVWDRFTEIVAAGHNSSIGYACVVASLQGDVSKQFHAEIEAVIIYIIMLSMPIYWSWGGL